jgi:transposase
MALNSNVLVDLPNKGLIVAHSGKYPYVYHVTETYRDSAGHPTNKRRSIGKLDKGTGKLIPNNAYYEIYGVQEESSLPVSAGEIHEAGVTFLAARVFSSLGIDIMLNDVFGADRSGALTTVAAYMLLEGNVMSYIEDFCERSLCGRHISDKTASRLFASVTSPERMGFFQKWVLCRVQNEYIAYDVTSFSSYSEGIADTEWGYNRDGERLPQINMGLYLGQTSLLPVFYVTYPGSIVDKSHLPFMMAYNTDLGIENVRFVMDKGFVSTGNMEYMRASGHPFLAAVEGRFKAFKDTLTEHRVQVRSSRNHIDSLGVFGLGVKGRFYGIAATLHIYYDPDREAAQTADMYRKIASEKEELAQLSEATEEQLRKYEKHFLITREGKKFTFEVNHEAVDSLACGFGYFSLLTNDSLTSEEALTIYRRKDTIEKAFSEIKNHIDMKRLRTHNQATTDGKMFCAFLSLILRMHIGNVLAPWMRENDFTMERVLREMTKVRVISTGSRKRLLNPLTKRQREILSALGASEDNMKSFVEAHPKT